MPRRRRDHPAAASRRASGSRSATAAIGAAVAALQFASAAAQNLTVYVGSGGCDSSDSTCHDKPQQQRVLQAMSLNRDGELTPRSDLSMVVDDLPVWMASAGPCVFITQPNKDAVVSYKWADGRLSPAPSPNVTGSGGRTPVFATPTPDGRFLLVANYNGPDDAKVSNGATAASFRIEADCHLTLVDSKPHTGSSADPQRQGAAHVHSVVPVRDGLAFACDLGMDLIFTYEVQADGKLNQLSTTRTAPGLGPRHLVQHPSKPVVYVICEMGQAVLSYHQGAGGTLNLMQTMSLLPEGASAANNKAAEIAIKADGTALYATNRGVQNTVTAFKVNWDGTLEKLQEVHAPDFPRGMTLTPDNSFLIVGGQSASVVATHRIQPSGALETPSRSTGDGVPPNPAAFLVLSSPARSHDDQADASPAELVL